MWTLGIDGKHIQKCGAWTWTIYERWGSLSLSLPLHRLLDRWGYTVTLTLTLLWRCNGIRHNNAIWDCLKMADVMIQTIHHWIFLSGIFAVFRQISQWLVMSISWQVARNIPGRIPQIQHSSEFVLKWWMGILFMFRYLNWGHDDNILKIYEILRFQLLRTTTPPRLEHPK